MKSILFKNLFDVIVILLIAEMATASGGMKTKALEEKIDDISMLRAKIIDKIDQAVEMRHGLEENLIQLRAEIRSEQTRAEIYSHPAALQNLRIRYNLSLIQTLQAYIDLLTERIDYFQTGNVRLKFLIDQVQDDLALIDVLEDMHIKNLIDRIDLVLNEFNPEMQKPIINAAHIRLLPTEYVWEKICLKADDLDRLKLKYKP